MKKINKAIMANMLMRNNFGKILIFITIIAFILRLLVSYELSLLNGGINSVLTPSSLSDLATYMKLAKDMANFQYTGEFYYQPFYYAVFLPIIYIVSGSSIYAVIFVQALLGGATVFLVGRIGAKLFGRKSGIVAAILTAISTPLLLYVPFHQNETLQSFNITLLLYFSLISIERKRALLWGVVGLICAVAILTRGNILIFVPVILVAIIVSMRKNLKKTFLALFLFFAGLIILQLPFAIHNSIKLGSLQGPSTAANQVLALGNSYEAPAGGRNPGLGAGAMEYPESYHDMMLRVEKENISVAKQMFNWMIDSPLSFFELQFRKLLLFWDGREIPNNVSLYGEGEGSIILRYLLLGRSSFLLTLAIAGVLFFIGMAIKKRSLRFLLLYYFVISYWFAVSIFYILSRFRAPILPVTTIFAGGFVMYVIKGFSKKDDIEKRKFVIKAGIAIVVGCFLSVSAYDLYRGYEMEIFKIVRPKGTIYKKFDNTKVSLDHGPYTMGGWSEIPLKAGMKIEKISPFVGDLTVEFSIIALTANSQILCEIGDEMKWFYFKNIGIEKISFPYTSKDKTIKIKFVKLKGEFSLLYDNQRNYLRSMLNNTPISGEWIIRLKTK